MNEKYDWTKPITKEQEYSMIRASGDVICSICGKEYRKHPMEKRILSYDGYPFLHQHCDGTLLKL